ncbi:MAG: hypothetical protein ACK4NC_01840 [Candidatus Gracilibacteria bacterium]
MNTLSSHKVKDEKSYDLLLPVDFEGEIACIRKSIEDLGKANTLIIPKLQKVEQEKDLLMTAETYEDLEKILDGIKDVFSLISYMRDALFDRINSGILEDSLKEKSVDERILAFENMQRGLFNTYSSLSHTYLDSPADYAEIATKEKYTADMKQSTLSINKIFEKDNAYWIGKWEDGKNVKPNVLGNILKWEDEMNRYLMEAPYFQGDEQEKTYDSYCAARVRMFKGMKMKFIEKLKFVGKKVSNQHVLEVNDKKFEELNLHKDTFLRLYHINRTIDKVSHEGLKQYLTHRMFAECRAALEDGKVSIEVLNGMLST